MFTFTPLLGAQTLSSASQSLLEFEEGARILVDLGSTDVLDVEALTKLVPSLSLILLTHATTSHLGAYAHCCKHIPLFLQIPIYATAPVIALGQQLIDDDYHGSATTHAFVTTNNQDGETSIAASKKILYTRPSEDEIRFYFRKIHSLKYSEPHQPLSSPFTPPIEGLTITAFNSGHSLGGTIWSVQHGLESVVYAVDWNLVPENVFNGAAWLDTSGQGTEVVEQLRKPTALICSAKGVERPPAAGGRAKRDSTLLDHIRAGVGRGGTVLVHASSSSRVLELAYVVERAFRKATDGDILKSARLYYAAKNASKIVKASKGLTEWMSAAIIREDEANSLAAGDGKTNARAADANFAPFDLQHLRCIESRPRLNRVLAREGAKVLFVCERALNYGFAKETLEQIGSNPSNLVVLTDEFDLRDESELGGNETIGHTLWKWSQDRSTGGVFEKGSSGTRLEQVQVSERDLEYSESSRMPLEGDESTKYQAFLASQKQAFDATNKSGQAALESSADVVEDGASTASSSSSEGSETGRQGHALNAAATQAATARQIRHQAGEDDLRGVNALLKAPGMYDWDVRGKRGRDTMFPYIVKKRKADEYGEIIRPEDYLRAEEKQEAENELLEQGESQNVGIKRKWNEVSETDNPARPKKLARARSTDDPNAVKLNGEGLHHDSSDDSGDDEDDYEPEQILGPSKLTYTTKTLRCNFRLAFIDCSGMHDARSISNLLPFIAPRKVIIIAGSKTEVDKLASVARQQLKIEVAANAEDSAITTPQDGTSVDASMDTHAWNVKISPSLYRTLKWQTVRGFQVVTLAAKLGFDSPEDKEKPDETNRRKRQKLDSTSQELVLQNNETALTVPSTRHAHTVPILQPLDPNAVSSRSTVVAPTRRHASTLHLGSLRLSDLRKLLLAEGRTAEFKGEGTLVVDGTICVKKSGDHIVVEGGVDTQARTAVLGLRRDRGRGERFGGVLGKIYEGLAVVGD